MCPYKESVHKDMTNTKLWAISILAILCGWFLAVSGPSLTPVFIAICLTYFIHPLVAWTQRLLKLEKKIIAVMITMAMIIVVFVVLISISLPVLVAQVTRFAREFSGYSMRFIRLMDEIEGYFVGLGLDSRITSQLYDFLQQLVTLVGSFLMSFVTTAISSISRFTDFVIIVILLFYFLLDGPDMIHFLVGRTPANLRKSCENIIDGISSVIWGYMKNQLLISTIHGIGCYIAFLCIGLPFSGLLGILNGVLNMIPYFGSIIASIISVLVALFYLGTQSGVLTALAVFALNMILGNILTPKLQGKTLGIHPVLVITALLVFNYIWGATGMFVAVPLLGLAQLVLREVLGIIRQL